LRAILATAYIIGLLTAEGLRLRQRFLRASSEHKRYRPESFRRISEAAVIAVIAGGIWILPVLYVFTDLLQAFDYYLPDWAGCFGIGVFLAGIVLRWAAQSSLGSSWSPSLETGSQQRLVTSGIYGWIRHPLYTSLIFWAVAQPILLQNIAAGFSGAFAVALIWFVRVPAEERMMCARFGDAYVQYMERTGKVIPRLR